MNIQDDAISNIRKALEFFGWLFAPESMTKAITNRAKGHAAAQIATQASIEQSMQDHIILCPPNTSPEVVYRAMQDFFYKAVLSRERREDIAYQAYNMLSEEARNTSQPLRAEFADRMAQYSGEIADAEARKLWAILLADEVQHPGNISLRTLDVLRNMTSEEAKTLKKYSAFTLLNICFIEKINTILPPEYISNDFNILYDAGLVEPAHMSSSFHLKPHEEMIYETLSGICTIKNISESIIVFSGVTFTQAGRELVRLDSLPPDFNAIFNTLSVSEPYKNLECNYETK